MIADEIRAFLARHDIPQAELARLLEPDDPLFRHTLNRWLADPEQARHQQPRHPGTIRLALAELARRLDTAGG